MMECWKEKVSQKGESILLNRLCSRSMEPFLENMKRWDARLEGKNARLLSLGWWENRGAGATQPHLLFQRHRGARTGGAAQDGTDFSFSWVAGSLVQVDLLLVIEDKGRVRDIAKGLGAQSQLVEGVEGAGVASPVVFHKHLAAARVVRLLANVLETVGLTHFGVEAADGEVLVWPTTIAVAVVALDTHVERVEVFVFIAVSHVVRRFYQTAGSGNVPVETFSLHPLILSAPQAPPTVMQSMTRLDFIDCLSGVGASDWSHAREHHFLVALTWNKMFLLKLSTYSSSNTCEL